MTYPKIIPLVAAETTTFDNGASAAPVTTVPIMEQGRAALEKINGEKGLGFDDFDLDKIACSWIQCTCLCHIHIHINIKIV